MEQDGCPLRIVRTYCASLCLRKGVLPEVLFFLAAFLVFGLIDTSKAATIAVVLSDNTAPYLETADAIEGRLGKEHTVIKIQASFLGQSETALNNARMIVSVGVEAARRIAERRSRTPVLAILIPKAWYESEGKAALTEGGKETGAIFIDQPLNRQFHLIRSAFPSLTRVGLVLGKQASDRLPELERQAKAHRVTLVSAVLDPSRKLVAQLEEILENADILLLAFPDPEVLTRTSAQSIFMTSYRYRDPVVGYSQSLSRAGALLTVYSTPSQIGSQAAEVLNSALGGDRLPSGLWPRYFSISINGHVARSLNISVPSESVLMKNVQEAESHDHD